MSKKGVTDDDLEKILDLVHLTPIVRREGGWDARGMCTICTNLTDFNYFNSV